MRGIITFLLGTLLVIVLTTVLLHEDEGEVITIGASSGPFADMATYALKPVLEDSGYSVEVIEYSDYIQPNNALANGDIDANLFQNVLFIDSYNEENNTELKNIIQVPTAPMGLYSGTFDSIESITSGSEVALPLDPVNASRGFLTLQDAGLITISEDADMFAIEEADIIDNKKNLEFIFQDAGQLPRSVDQIGLSLVPGNFALASDMKLEDALSLENMNEYFRNQIVINGEDAGSKMEEDLINAVESDEFNEVIDADFQGFDKPKEDE